MSLPGTWEFPGGKVERRESPHNALIREVREELGLGIKVGCWLGRGESIVNGRQLVLDVYYATPVDGDPDPREHAQIRWIEADGIADLDWPEADRPVLPFLRRALDRGLGERPLARPIPIVSVDWAKNRRGRAVYTACLDSGVWLIERESPPGCGWTLEEVLSLAERKAEPFGGSALIAIDAVLGVPSRYGIQTNLDGFPAVMEWLDEQGALDRFVQDPDRWSLESPFFSVQPGEGGLTGFIERAGGRAVLYRELERVTGAKTVFATSGIPGTVGSGSVALWREILAVRRSGRNDFRIWPFEVEMEEISSLGCPVIAESYPRACYGVALAPSLPAVPVSLSKTARDTRIAYLDELRRAPWVRDRFVILTGIEFAEQSDDDFDALMQAAALVRMSDSQTPLSSHLVDPIWEGGILGTGGLTLDAPSPPRMRSEPSAPPSEGGASPKQCPIPGCVKIFRSGRLGWDAHVASVLTHSDWEPSLISAEERKSAFRAQFSAWLVG